MLKKYQPFFVFLGKFFLTYIVLIILYQLFLSQFDAEKFEADSMTQLVADQTQILLKAFDYNARLEPHKQESSVLVFIDETPIVRIVEGCNAISIMILFAAFIVAFSGKFLRTLAYILGGIMAIHILNVLRIVFLIMGIVHYPEYESFLHDIAFPLVIYGFIVLLWILWVNKFQGYAKKNTPS